MSQKKNNTQKYELIEISEEEYDIVNNCSDSNISTDEHIEETAEEEGEDEEIEEENAEEDEDEGDDSNSDYEVVVIKKEKIDAEEPVIEFITFCVKNGMFDDTFYDYTNIFSVMATKLPITFDKMSKDGKHIKNKAFKNLFIKSGFKGDINYIYNLIDTDKKGYITWEQFTEFFFPFVKYVTM